MAFTAQDIAAGIDPTGYANISGAELLQMVQSAAPKSGARGIIVWSKDTAEGIPDVPDPSSIAKFKQFLWVREPFSTGVTTVYVWCDLNASVATYLKWVAVAAALPPGSVTTTVLADGAVTTDKVLDGAITAAKLAAGVIPTQWYQIGSNVAGGSLSGTYPSPSIAAGAVNENMLASTVGGKLVGKTYVEEVTAVAISTASASNVIPSDDTIPQKTEGYTLLTAAAFTPKALTNYLQYKAVINWSLTNGSGSAKDVVAAICYSKGSGASNDALAAACKTQPTQASVALNTASNQLVVEGRCLVSSLIGALEALTFQLNFGVSATYADGSGNQLQVNSGNGTRKFGGVMRTFLIIEEYRPN